ncbi:MAG: hypothetical protein A2252_04340 [Elusimicrobia bacterium RIFOXYA2_FULL_39_19]|nr:MAG: hypothetical protein A2252_04340 [Elusimicrobia bacterium RIFOXYA2_FULL_39_19]
MLTPAKDIVKKLLAQYGINNETYALYDVWNKELGKIAKKARMIGKTGGTILVHVDNPIYKQELTIRKKEFIKKINDHFGRRIVDDIKIVKKETSAEK